MLCQCQSSCELANVWSSRPGQPASQSARHSSLTIDGAPFRVDHPLLCTLLCTLPTTVTFAWSRHGSSITRHLTSDQPWLIPNRTIAALSDMRHPRPCAMMCANAIRCHVVGSTIRSPLSIPLSTLHSIPSSDEPCPFRNLLPTHTPRLQSTL